MIVTSFNNYSYGKLHIYMNSSEKNMNLPIAHDCVTFVLYTLLRILYPAPFDCFKQPFKLKVLMQDADSFALI